MRYKYVKVFNLNSWAVCPHPFTVTPVSSCILELCQKTRVIDRRTLGCQSVRCDVIAGWPLDGVVFECPAPYITETGQRTVQRTNYTCDTWHGLTYWLLGQRAVASGCPHYRSCSNPSIYTGLLRKVTIISKKSYLKDYLKY